MGSTFPATKSGCLHNNFSVQENDESGAVRRRSVTHHGKPLEGYAAVCWKNRDVDFSRNRVASLGSGGDRASSSRYAQPKLPPQKIDEETKIWNLRPRKPLQRWPPDVNGGGFSIGKSISSSQSVPTINNRCLSVERGGDFMEKLFVALSKEEIEEDVFAMTGSKPTRRPKKRPKQIQKLIDPLLPGNWLLSITEDSYKVGRVITD